ncbi:chorismate synthase, putative [Actinidia rufa]|uniref:chorismate synthase n=1 Tax=Actinidia rufa TaxID=165716 RepID=A0A7J0EDZ9_9ERIC|nr:chorismate synthase, putative [Actinidia rufa]
MSEKYLPYNSDATYDFKYGLRFMWVTSLRVIIIIALKGGGRSSAKETIGRVAAGAVAKKILKHFSGTEGLGSPVFDKLEAELAKAAMSLPASKGCELGSGFAAVPVGEAMVALVLVDEVMAQYAQCQMFLINPALQEPLELPRLEPLHGIPL